MNELNVLVAEDNQISQEMIALVLKTLGVECTVVENGEEALKLIEEGPFDLLILDQHMPVMTGLETLSAIRNLETSAQKLPIIIISGDELSGDAKKYFDAGADACLSKPIKADQLAETMQQVLN